MIEIFKDIQGYEGLYQVSNLGRVKSLKCYANNNERILKPAPNSKGYLQVCLYGNGKGKPHRVHRLVASAFLPNPQNLPQINHRDEDKANNHVTNLEWCTNLYNSVYNNKHWKKGKPFICVETEKIYHSTRECCNELNLCRRSLMRHLNGKRGYSHIKKLHFRYI